MTYTIVIHPERGEEFREMFVARDQALRDAEAWSMQPSVRIVDVYDGDALIGSYFRATFVKP